jgi:hypothetical protein
MESILPMHDEAYPLKSRRNKSSAYLANTLHIRRSTITKRNIFSLSYQHIKTMIAQRIIYILGVLNLILAGIAIVCVTQAEDNPEYFSLVYISISIFIFYMTTIICIIIIQIIETYQEHHQKNRSSLSIQMPLLTTKQSSPIIIESMTTKTQARTSLSRSHTLPINPHYQTLPPSNRLGSLPQNPQPIINIPKNYQSFALTTNNRFYPLYTTIINSDSSPNLSSLIKPIPFKSHENNRSKIKFVEY